MQSQLKRLWREILGLSEVGFNTLRVSEGGDLRLPEAGMHIPGVLEGLAYGLENRTMGSVSLPVDLEAVRVPEVRESPVVFLGTTVRSHSTLQIISVAPFETQENVISPAPSIALQNHDNPAFANSTEGFRETGQLPVVGRNMWEQADKTGGLGGALSGMGEDMDATNSSDGGEKSRVGEPLLCFHPHETIDLEDSPDQISLLQLLSSKCLDFKPRSGRPAALTEVEKDHLVHTVKRNFTTRRMTLVDIRRESGLSHVSDSTVWKALNQRGIKAYREEFKFILKPENKVLRLAYCNERKSWTIRDWANYGFTDEMSIEVGGLFGLNLVWRDNTERWHSDCVGAMKKQGVSVMCWGMIGWGWKGPFHVWESETEDEKEEAAKTIAILEAERLMEETQLNEAWRESEEWAQLKIVEQGAYRIQRQLEKHENAAKRRIPQTRRAKKYKIEKYKRGDGNGVDSWRYVKAVARPILWPECHRQLEQNPLFILMEDNAPSHSSHYTTREREKEGIQKVDWPPNSRDLNPIEHIWALMKSRIQT